MTCGVYEFWCGPHFYQGSSKNIEKRWKSHQRELRKGQHYNPKIQRAYDKYGWTDAGVLVECEDYALLAWEQAYIDTNWGDEKYLNLSPTADRPPILKGVPKPSRTPEHRAKLSAAGKARTHSDEHRAKVSAALKGRPVSEETRAKIGAAHKGKAISEDARAKMSAAHKGVPKSAEHRAKIGAAQKGKKGQTHSDETRAKMSASRKAYTERKRAEKMDADILDLFGMGFA